MKDLLLPSLVGIATVGFGFGMAPASPRPVGGTLPSLILLSAPVGGEAVPGRTVNHPSLNEWVTRKSIRVVLASPFGDR